VTFDLSEEVKRQMYRMQFEWLMNLQIVGEITMEQKRRF